MKPEKRWRETLDRHRDDVVPRIRLSIPVDRLVDREYCNRLASEIARLAPEGWERCSATPTAYKILPDRPGLYMFVWNPGQVVNLDGKMCDTPFILYVGKAGGPGNSSNLRARYKNEYAKMVGGDPEQFWGCDSLEDRRSRLSVYLSLFPLEIWYLVISDVEAIAGLEKRLFNLYAPPLNGAGGRRLRPIKVVEAF